MTAIEEDIPIVVVVFNNAALGWVLHGGTGFAAKFNDFDFASIARAHQGAVARENQAA